MHLNLENYAKHVKIIYILIIGWYLAWILGKRSWKNSLVKSIID